jgi:DNA polymerase III subunit gamma/tau
LQLTLDLFKDLQASLQPRLHLEIGLLRLVQAGRLVTIEEALSDLGSGGSAAAPSRKPSAPPPTRSAAPPTPNPQSPTPASSPTGPWKDRLHAAAVGLGMQTTADAIEHSQIAESSGTLNFVTPEDYRLFTNEKDILKIVQKVAGRPMRFEITYGTPQATGAPLTKPKDDVSERALAHPEVRRFQELFPDAQVRQVRNLKE